MFVTPSSRALRKRGVRGPGLISGSGPSAFQSGAGSRLSNLGLSVSASGSALTIALKGADGNDPSASNPVDIDFRNATGTAGTPSTLSITSPTSLVVSSGSTLGVSSSTAFRLWVVGFNDGGAFRLGIVNCASGSSVRPLAEWALNSSTAEGGAGAADSAQTIYTDTAVTSKPMRVLGFIEWNTSGVTAGTWTTTNLSTIQIAGAGVPFPGDVIQVANTTTGALVTGTTAIPLDDTIPQSTEGTQLFTLSVSPVSAANLLCVVSYVQIFVDSGQVPTAAMFQDSTANAVATAEGYGGGTGNSDARLYFEYWSRANTTSATTFKVRGGPHSAGNMNMNGRAGTRVYGGTSNSGMTIREIMA